MEGGKTMRKLLILSLLVLALITGLMVGCANPSPSQNIEPTATTFVNFLGQEQFDEAYELFNEDMAKAMPVEKLRATWEGLIAQVGEFKGITKTRSTVEAGYSVVYITCDFAKTPLDVKVVFDQQAKIAGLWFEEAG
jgi:hypothetical protein